MISQAKTDVHMLLSCDANLHAYLPERKES